MKNSIRYREDQALSRKIKSYCKSENKILISTDKTSRNIFMDRTWLIDNTKKILDDNKSYLKIKKNRTLQLEKQANKLMNTQLPNFISTTRDKECMLSSGSNPANFFVAVKDHKKCTNNNYPLRPIASVHDTPVDKLDWVVEIILTQALKFVKSHLQDTITLLDRLDNFNHNHPDIQDHVFISLDVVALYPSIPISDGIEKVIEFLITHADNINFHGLSIEHLKNILTFICFNYEIKFLNDTYKQINGVPMGARFAPPFSIIYMDYIETTALSRLENYVVPSIYSRYIDDTLLGPLPNDRELFDIMLQTFNSVHPNIQFTIDIPLPTTFLPYLDIQIKIINNRIAYKWFMKDFHSFNSLNKFSHIPSSSKFNFVLNRIKCVIRRCNTEDGLQESLTKLYIVMKHNDFNDRDISNAWSHINNNTGKRKNNDHYTKNNFLTLPFISDRANRKINKAITKSNLPITLINSPGRKIKTLSRLQYNDKCRSCNICDILPASLDCQRRHLVYNFKCNLCGDAYIGQTNRRFKDRFLEHERSISKSNNCSALSDHLRKFHPNQPKSITNFNLTILDYQKDSISTAISESLLIKKHQPKINRKEELTTLI